MESVPGRKLRGMSLIYRILARADWEAFESAGVFRGTAHDLRDGFIHFSAAHQVEGTAAKHYADQRDLVLVHVETDRLGDAQLKWEPSRGGDLFPHLYGALRSAAVIKAEAYRSSPPPGRLLRRISVQTVRAVNRFPDPTFSSLFRVSQGIVRPRPTRHASSHSWAFQVRMRD